MPRKIRKCSECSRYPRPLLRCLDGKINPPTIKGGVDAVKLMGLSYICPFAKYYDKIKAVLVSEMENKQEKILSSTKED